MTKRNWFLFCLIIILSVFFDQLTKILVLSKIPLYGSTPVISDFFNLVHTTNRGMAFGFLNSPEAGTSFYILTGASVLAIIFITFWFTRLKDNEKVLIPGLALILGGAAGNLIDRIRIGEVIDFLDIQIGTYHWPAFNIADSCVSVGTIWVIICLLFIIKPDK